jgi:hypothetical protein
MLSEFVFNEDKDVKDPIYKTFNFHIDHKFLEVDARVLDTPDCTFNV